MVSRYGKKQWVVPVLEKIEMANTRLVICGAQSNPLPKNNPGPEQGNCGAGS